MVKQEVEEEKPEIVKEKKPEVVKQEKQDEPEKKLGIFFVKPTFWYSSVFQLEFVGNICLFSTWEDDPNHQPIDSRGKKLPCYLAFF